MQDDFAFWGNQATEHALFMHLGLEDPALKAEALRLYESMKAAYDAGPAGQEHFLFLLGRSMEFKQRVLARLLQGEWLGWLYPLFVDHILREEAYFLAKLQGMLPPLEEAPTWLRFMREHAQFAAHLIDPTESAAIATAGQQAGQLARLEGGCAVTCSPQLLALSERQGRELDQFFSTMKPANPKSIIHPALAAHVVREGRRFVDVMQRLRTGQPT